MKLFGELLLNDEEGDLNQFRIELPRIIFSREGKRFPLSRKDIKKIVDPTNIYIYTYIKRNKQVVTQLYLRVCLCTTLKPRLERYHGTYPTTYRAASSYRGSFSAPRGSSKRA